MRLAEESTTASLAATDGVLVNQGGQIEQISKADFEKSLTLSTPEVHTQVLTFTKSTHTETSLSQSGAIAYTLAADTHKDGVVKVVQVLSDGVNPITFSADFTVYNKSEDDVYPAGFQEFWFCYLAGSVRVSIPTYAVAGQGGSGSGSTLAAPAGLSASGVSSTEAAISWDNVTGNNGYELQHSTNNSTWSVIASPAVDVNSYLHTGLTAGSTNYYRVKAFGDGTATFNSAYSASVSVTLTTVTYEAEATALFSAMATQPTAQHKLDMNTLIKSLKDNGVWVKLDRLFVWAAHTNGGGEALKDWTNPARSATTVSSPVFTALRGFKGNGAGYINTGYSPLNNGVNYSLNSASVAHYIRAQGFTSGAFSAAAPSTRNEVRWDTSNYTAINDATSSGTVVAGMNIVQRESSTTKRLITNNTAITSSATSTRVVSENQYVLARNNGGTADALATNGEVSLSAYGNQFTQAEWTAFTNAVETYMDAIGAGVITS